MSLQNPLEQLPIRKVRLLVLVLVLVVVLLLLLMLLLPPRNPSKPLGSGGGWTAAATSLPRPL